MYVGGICGVIGAFFYEAVPAAEMSAWLAIGIPMLCSLAGSLLMGLLCLLTVTLPRQSERHRPCRDDLRRRHRQLLSARSSSSPEARSRPSRFPPQAISASAVCRKARLVRADLPVYGFLAYLAIVIALLASYFLKHTRPGLSARRRRERRDRGRRRHQRHKV